MVSEEKVSGNEYSSEYSLYKSQRDENEDNCLEETEKDSK
jgi:hypothetical protein